MVKDRCCSCSITRFGTCKNCACVKANRACTDCLVSRDGKCLNLHGQGVAEEKKEKLICPFAGCTAGRNGRPREVRFEDISRLRYHLSDHINDVGYVVSSEWLDAHESRLCPGCDVAVVALSGRCDGCKKRTPDSCFDVSAPRARYLPKLELNHVDQLSLGASEKVLNAGLPRSIKFF